jgi:hypothetical protein
MKIKEIPKLWKNNQAGKASKSFYTDGLNIYSYKLKIGYTNEYGEKVLLKYTTSSGHFQSMTTSRHVNLTAFHADKFERPSSC